MPSIDVVWNKVRKTEDAKILDNLVPGQILYDLDERARKLPPGVDWSPYVTPIKVARIHKKDGWVELDWDFEKKFRYWVLWAHPEKARPPRQ